VAGPDGDLGTPYRWLLATTAVGTFGGALVDVTVPLIALLVLRADPFEVSAVLAAEQLPWLLIGLPAGVWVDRWSPRTVLIACALARALLLAGLVTAGLSGVLTLGLLFLVVAGLGTLSVFAAVADAAVLPSIVPRYSLVVANGRLMSTSTVADLAGGAIGGVLVQAVSAFAGAFVDAAGSLFSCLALFRLPRRPARKHVPTGRHAFLREAGEGLRQVWGDPALRTLTASNAVWNLCISGQYALAFTFLQRDLRVAPGAIAILLTLGGLGGLAGAALAGRLASRWGTGRLWRTVLVVAPAVGLAVPAAGPGRGLGLFLVGSAGLAAAVAITNVVGGSARQARCPAALIGRVSATTRLVAWAAIPLGALLAGAAATAVDTRTVLWLVGLGFFGSPLIARASRLWTAPSLEDDPIAPSSGSRPRAPSRP
jgi:predicted MFS family arabinose efflux permease